jgi:hypothetical protein
VSAVEPASHDDGVGDTGIRKIATTLGVGTGTVQRIKESMSA